MIISVEDLKKHIKTDVEDSILAMKIAGVESHIRKYTNNDFQNRFIRFRCDCVSGSLNTSCMYLNAKDTVQITQSKYNGGLYEVKQINAHSTVLDGTLLDEKGVLVTKVEYPLDVKMGVIDILRWKLKNENVNYNPNAEKEIQSESISRHSVTYAKDSTESDIDEEFGVPRKYIAFLNDYIKARF